MNNLCDFLKEDLFQMAYDRPLIATAIFHAIEEDFPQTDYHFDEMLMRSLSMHITNNLDTDLLKFILVSFTGLKNGISVLHHTDKLYKEFGYKSDPLSIIITAVVEDYERDYDAVNAC